MLKLENEEEKELETKIDIKIKIIKFVMIRISNFKMRQKIIKQVL